MATSGGLQPPAYAGISTTLTMRESSWPVISGPFQLASAMRVTPLPVTWTLMNP
jgi:hypothetical protein